MIDNIKNLGIGPKPKGLDGGGGRDLKGTKPESSASMQAPTADSVQISDSAQALNQVDAATPPMDQDKVDRIKQAIEQGEYTINYEVLASGITADALSEG